MRPTTTPSEARTPTVTPCGRTTHLRMEVRELNTRNRMSEEMARSEHEAMEKDARCALFHQKKHFQSAVREYQRQATDAANRAVQESSESCEVLMIQEIQGVQNRYEGE